MSNEPFTPRDTTKPYQVIIIVVKHPTGNHPGITCYDKTRLAQTSLWFESTSEVLEWADDAGVDFS